jgi:hypothetical protein
MSRLRWCGARGASANRERTEFDDRRFEDTPRAPWPNGFFQGFAYLSKVDFDKREQTVYEGLAYGFTQSADPKPAPGPATLLLIIVGALGARIAARRRRA